MSDEEIAGAQADSQASLDAIAQAYELLRGAAAALRPVLGGKAAMDRLIKTCNAVNALYTQVSCALCEESGGGANTVPSRRKTEDGE